MRKLLLLGGGGHCKSVIDSLIGCSDFDEIGIVDNNLSVPVCGVNVIGTDDDLVKLKKQGWNYAFVSVGSVGDSKLRRKLFYMIKECGFEIPVVIDSTAIIARNVRIDEGVYIGKRAVINTAAQIDRCSIINTGAIVEHDCTVGEFAHISSGAVLCGNVIIGSNAHIGAGCSIKQGVRVGSEALIGMGSNVIADIPSGSKSYGNPCRVV